MRETAPILRHWKILRSLSARGTGATLREMAEDTGVSQKTISRDLLMLKQVGFSLVETVGDQNRKNWRLEQAQGIPPITFTIEEAAALYLGRQFLQPLAGTLFYSGAHTAFEKIRALLGDAPLRHLQKLATAFYHKSVGLADYTGKEDLIDRLVQACEDRRLTVITYQSLRSTEPVTYFDLHPYGLVWHKHALYLLAKSSEKQKVQTYKVDRITEVEIQRLTFDPPADLDLQASFANSFGIFQNSQPQVLIRVRFSQQVVRLLEETQHHPSQSLQRQSDGSVLAEFRLSTLEEFQNWILSFGPFAEVLEPASLRESIAQSLRETLEGYTLPPSNLVTLVLPQPASSASNKPSPPRRKRAK